MSVNSVLSAALSGLQASQAGMRSTSANISNVNTPGYAREEVQFSSRTLNGVSSGVSVDAVRRITDAFLIASALNASARAKGAQVVNELLDRVQAVFGDPSSSASVFSQLNEMFASFAELGADPSSPVRRAGSINDLKTSLIEFERLASEIQAARSEADSRISNVVDRINDLLADVGTLNSELTREAATGGASGAQNALAQVLDELGELIDIRVIQQQSGAVEVRTKDGLLLAGHTVASLSYSSLGVATPGNVYPPILLNQGSATPLRLESHIGAGELRGLLDVRDAELPALAGLVGEFAGKTADALNVAHNQSVSYPPLQVLSGRNTGLLATDALNFQGATTITVLGADGSLQHTIDIDFTVPELSVDGGGAVGFANTVAGLQGALNTALGGFGGAATFTNGALSLDAGAGLGLGFVEDATTPSDRGGRTFAHFFGMNDLVTSARPLFFETGFQSTDAHGFTNGQTFDLRLQSANGSTLREATVTIGGATLGDVLTNLNDTVIGFGSFGTFAFDGDGELQFTPASGYESSQFKVLSDTTARGGTGRTFTELFGVGDGVRATRAYSVDVRADIDADPSRLSLGKIDLTGVTLGDIVTGSGDGAGGFALQASGSVSLAFDAAGGFPAMTSSLLDYAGRVAGDVGRRANAAERAQSAAEALRAEAAERRGSVEGVNIEEELVKLTTFQQSFNAASRLVQAAREMSDTLINMI